MIKKSTTLLKITCFVLIECLACQPLAYAHTDTSTLSPKAQISLPAFSDNFSAVFEKNIKANRLDSAIKRSNLLKDQWIKKTKRDIPASSLTHKLAAYAFSLTFISVVCFVEGTYLYYKFFFKNQPFSFSEASMAIIVLFGIALISAFTSGHIINISNHGFRKQILSYRHLDGMTLLISQKAVFHPYGNPEIHLEVDKKLPANKRNQFLAHLINHELETMLDELALKGYYALDLATPVKSLSGRFRKLGLSKRNIDLEQAAVRVKLDYKERDEKLFWSLPSWIGVKLYYGLKNNALVKISNFKIQTLLLTPEKNLTRNDNNLFFENKTTDPAQKVSLYSAWNAYESTIKHKTIFPANPQLFDEFHNNPSEYPEIKAIFDQAKKRNIFKIEKISISPNNMVLQSI